MKRFNVFLLIHKGLRAMMYDVSISMQHTDFALANEYPHALTKLEAMLNTFSGHAHLEDKYLFSLLESCNPELATTMESEHATDHAIASDIHQLLGAFKTATTADEKEHVGQKLCYALNDFIAFNLTHLNKEETVVNESLWQHYSDADIIAANQRLVGSLSPEEAQASAVWMIRSCSNHEIISWINAIKANIPAPVFDLLLQLTQTELPAARAEYIQNGVLEVV